MPQEFTDDRFQEQLRDYLSGDLADKDQQAFEEQLTQSATAQEELAFSKQLRFVQQNADLFAIAAISKQLVEMEVSAAKGSSSGWSGYQWMGGLLLGITVIAFSWWGVNSLSETRAETAKLEAITTPYLIALEPLLATNTSREEALDVAMEDYRAQRYTLAAPALAAYAAAEKDPNAALYAGVSYLLSGQAKKALPLLEEAGKSAAPPIQEAAGFYQTLCLLQLKKQPEAIRMAQQAKEDNLYYTQYQDLLNALNN